MVVYGDYINNYGPSSSYGHREMHYQNTTADERVGIMHSLPSSILTTILKRTPHENAENGQAAHLPDRIAPFFSEIWSIIYAIFTAGYSAWSVSLCTYINLLIANACIVSCSRKHIEGRISPFIFMGSFERTVTYPIRISQRGLRGTKTQSKVLQGLVIFWKDRWWRDLYSRSTNGWSQF